MHTRNTCWGFVIMLTPWINFGRNDIFATMDLLVHKHDVSHHFLDVFVTSLNFILWFFSVEVFRIFHCLYLWVFGGVFYAIINGITPWILLSIYWLLAHRNNFLIKMTKLEYYLFPTPSELMYIGIGHQ